MRKWRCRLKTVENSLRKTRKLIRRCEHRGADAGSKKKYKKLSRLELVHHEQQIIQNKLWPTKSLTRDQASSSSFFVFFYLLFVFFLSLFFLFFFLVCFLFLILLYFFVVFVFLVFLFCFCLLLLVLLLVVDLPIVSIIVLLFL